MQEPGAKDKLIPWIAAAIYIISVVIVPGENTVPGEKSSASGSPGVQTAKTAKTAKTAQSKQATPEENEVASSTVAQVDGAGEPTEASAALAATLLGLPPPDVETEKAEETPKTFKGKTQMPSAKKAEAGEIPASGRRDVSLPTLEEEEIEELGSLSDAAFRKAVQARRFEDCAKEAARRFSGTFRVAFEILPSGEVTKATILKGKKGPDAELVAACVDRKAKRLRLAPFDADAAITRTATLLF